MKKTIEKNNYKTKLLWVIIFVAITIPLLAGQCSSPPEAKTHDLNITIIGSGQIELSIGKICKTSCSESLAEDSKVILRAKFGNSTTATGTAITWSGDCSGSTDSCSLKMDSDKTVTIEFDINGVVSIPDVNLAKKLRERLGLAADEDITKAHMLSLTFFRTGSSFDTPNNERISSLEGLQYAVNLLELSLNYNKITDISQIQNLKKLSTLKLGATKITDVTALKALTNLKEFSLFNNKITDFGALKDLTKLEFISIAAPWSEKLTLNDLSFLKNLSKLKYLSLRNTIPGDLAILKDLKELKELNLIGAINQSRLGEIKDLTNLEILRISNNKLDDITVLKDFVKLKTLSVSYNKIKDISVLKKLINLEKLFLNRNLLGNIDALVDNPGLTGDKDQVFITYNCLDIAGDDKANIDKLINRKINLTYDPQNTPHTQGCP